MISGLVLKYMNGLRLVMADASQRIVPFQAKFL